MCQVAKNGSGAGVAEEFIQVLSESHDDLNLNCFPVPFLS